jgi:hypothetical protein
MMRSPVQHHGLTAPMFQGDNPCASTHRAIAQASSKGHAGYAVQGVVAVKCARHAFVLPNGVVDLEKGEKYVSRSRDLH